jgi:hypothetical protein
MGLRHLRPTRRIQPPTLRNRPHDREIQTITRSSRRLRRYRRKTPLSLAVFHRGG